MYGRECVRQCWYCWYWQASEHKQELYAQIAGSIKAVPTKLARVVKANPEKLARAIKMATADENEGGSD